MNYDKSYFEGDTPGGYTNYAKTAIPQVAAKVKQLLPIIDGKGPVLIAGCAYGFLVEELVKCGVDAYGLDISEYALSQASDNIKPRLVRGSVTEVGSYIEALNKAKSDMFSYLVSENMHCCLSDNEAYTFQFLSIFFSYRVVHLVEDRPALAQWYNYKPIDILRKLYGYQNVQFEIQA
jgi:cyclopropane fatty-acyl-phospholipid synthase-like methyltransferase